MHDYYLLHKFFLGLQPAPCVVRAAAVKAELSDTEGLRFKLDEKNHDIVELKKTVKMKVCYYILNKCVCYHSYIPSGTRLK